MEQIVLTSPAATQRKAAVTQIAATTILADLAAARASGKTIIGTEIGLPSWVRNMADGTELPMTVTGATVSRIETEKAVIYSVLCQDGSGRKTAVTLNPEKIESGVLPVVGASFTAVKSSYTAANGSTRATFTQQ